MTDEKSPETKVNLLKWMPSVVRNSALLGGASMAFVGLWWERPSLALVALGVSLAAAGAWSASRSVMPKMDEGSS